MKKSLLLIILFSQFSLAQITSSQGRKTLPLVEGGVGAVSVQVPHYPGSSKTRTFTIPFPALIYRGEILRADEDGGIRSRFFLSDSLEVNLSFGGSLPANSEDNPERQGMPDLKTMFEFGPGLIIHLIRSTSEKNIRMGINIPLRLSISTNLKKTEERGLVFNPLLYYIHEGIPLSEMILFTSFGIRFSSRKNQDTFYTVHPVYQTSYRPSYRAHSGYMGSNLSLGLSYTASKNLSIFGGIDQGLYYGASNRKSPLFKRKTSTSIALGFVWWFYQSREVGYKR